MNDAALLFLTFFAAIGLCESFDGLLSYIALARLSWRARVVRKVFEEFKLEVVDYHWCGSKKDPKWHGLVRQGKVGYGVSLEGMASMTADQIREAVRKATIDAGVKTGVQL